MALKTSDKNWLLALAVLGFALAGSSIAARADSLAPKSDLFVAREAAQHRKTDKTSPIVRLEADLAPARESQLKAPGAAIYRRLSIVQSVALTLPNCSLKALAALPIVKQLSSDLPEKKTGDFTDGASGAVKVSREKGLTGKGVIIAVPDSGVSTSPYTNPVVMNLPLGPTLTQDTSGSVSVDMDRILWSTTMANRVIWGVSGVNDLRVIWGVRVIWGTSTNILDASRVIWRTNSSAVDLTSTTIAGD